MSSLFISVRVLAQDNAWSWVNFLKLMGRNRQCQTKWKCACLCYSVMLPNQSMAFCGLLHWLAFEISLKLQFISSRITLLSFPDSLFAGLMSRQVGLFSKLSLWSLSEMNDLFVQFCHQFQAYCRELLINYQSPKWWLLIHVYLFL